MSIVISCKRKNQKLYLTKSNTMRKIYYACMLMIMPLVVFCQNLNTSILKLENPTIHTPMPFLEGLSNYNNPEVQNFGVGKEAFSTQEACWHGIESIGLDFLSGFGGDENNRLAVDVFVDTESFAVETIRINIVKLPDGPDPTFFHFNFLQDDNGRPGTIIHQDVSSQIMGSEFLGNNFGAEFHQFSMDVSDANIVLSGGESGTRYWMEVVTDALAWEMILSSYDGFPAFYKVDVFNEWYSLGNELVFEIEGECGDPLEIDVCDKIVADDVWEGALGMGGPENQLAAVDVDVAANTEFELQTLKVILAQNGAPTFIDLKFYENVDERPAELIQTLSDLNITESNFIMNYAGFDFYEYTIDLSSEEFVLTGGENGSKYWMELVTDPGYWASTSNDYSGLPAITYNNTTGGEWIFYGLECIYELLGECTEITDEEGCLEAENGQYPLDVFVPSCNETPEGITDELAWTGEYSVVQVTDGTEYIFSLSDSSYFITIGNEEGTEVLSYGIGTVTWTSDFDGNIRFYSHLDSDCNWDDETFLERYVQCGEVVEGCFPILNCEDGDVILNVTFQEIDNTTECSPNGYGDYTDMIAGVAAGQTYPISVTVGDGWYERVSLWIDFDNDGFDTGDFIGEIGDGGQGVTLEDELSIPSDVTDGEYKMRFLAYAAGSDNTAIEDPCINNLEDYGEYEDYTLNVGTLGINNLNTQTFSYYPNPTENILNISSKKNVEEISVFNMSGQKVFIEMNITAKQIDLSSLNSGIYLVRVKLEGGQIETFKIIKK